VIPYHRLLGLSQSNVACNGACCHREEMPCDPQQPKAHDDHYPIACFQVDNLTKNNVPPEIAVYNWVKSFLMPSYHDADPQDSRYDDAKRERKHVDYAEALDKTAECFFLFAKGWSYGVVGDACKGDEKEEMI